MKCGTNSERAIVDIHWEVDGRHVSESGLEDAIIKAVLEDITEQVQNELGEMTCPEHGEKPEVTIKYTDEGVEYQCGSCCEAFSEAVEAKITDLFSDDDADDDEGDEPEADEDDK